jgi:hypothetical protein
MIGGLKEILFEECNKSEKNLGVNTDLLLIQGAISFEPLQPNDGEVIKKLLQSAILVPQNSGCATCGLIFS